MEEEEREEAPARRRIVNVKRRATMLKKRICSRAYFEIAREVNPAILDDPEHTARRCWKQVCAHKFTSLDFSSPSDAETIRAAVRRWITEANFNMRPPPPRPARIEVQRGLPLQRMAPLIAAMPPEAMTIALQSAPPEVVERVFELLGHGASGRLCPLCDMPSAEWARLARGCSHEVCARCAIKWAQTSSVDAATCRDCRPERSAPLLDPRIMFGANALREEPRILHFVSRQLPSLQAALDEARPKAGGPPAISRCPDCSTVSVSGNNGVRRCLNPKCAAEFCLACDCVVGADEDLERHFARGCVAAARETAVIAAGTGLTPCPKCSTPIWHASAHGCHSVKCPKCSTRFCHACQTPYVQEEEHTPKCHCPIFCRPSFACRCSRACPECALSKCAHCDGRCDTCLERVKKNEGGGGEREMKE